MMNVQSFERLSLALSYYTEVCKFVYINIPWDVPPRISAITKPEHVKDINFIKGNVLVASGEQSFLHYYGILSNKDVYVGLTPCFRDEDNLDALHQQYFYKIELFSKDITRIADIQDSASNFFDTILESYTTVKHIDSNNTDLMIGDIELGSYGVRTHGHMKWAFGTGLAEPRFTHAFNWSNIQKKRQIDTSL